MSERTGGAVWKILLAGTAFLLALAFLVVALTVSRVERAAEKVPQKVSELFARLGEAFKAETDVDSVVHGSVTGMQKQKKLVVARMTLDVEVEKQENYRWWGINFGTTSAKVRTTDNRVQYVLPLYAIDATRFTFDPAAKTLRVVIPHPLVDTELVEVQSDPAKMQVYSASAWARFNKSTVTDEAKAMLRDAVIAQARNANRQSEADAAAREAMLRLLEPLQQSLRPGVKVVVEFP